MENLIDEIKPHIDRVLNNPKYHVKMKKNFVQELISILTSMLEDIDLEVERTEMLDYPDEMD